MEDRLLKLLDTEQLSSSKFADAIGVQRSSVSHILTGRNKPSFDFLQKTLKAFPMLNSDWLILGEGEMYEGEQSPGGGSLFDQPDVPGSASGPAISHAGEAQTEQSVSATDSGAHISAPGGDDTENSESRTVQQQMGQTPSDASAAQQHSGQNTPPGPPDTGIQAEPSPGSITGAGKKVRRVILFYDDNSFDAYEQA